MQQNQTYNLFHSMHSFSLSKPSAYINYNATRGLVTSCLSNSTPPTQKALHNFIHICSGTLQHLETDFDVEISEVCL